MEKVDCCPFVMVVPYLYCTSAVLQGFCWLPTREYTGLHFFFFKSLMYQPTSDIFSPFCQALNCQSRTESDIRQGSAPRGFEFLIVSP